METFLAALDPPKKTLSCDPTDLIRFLVWKDRHGRTKVHNSSCRIYGSSDRGLCECPSRLASGTVDSTIGKLRSIFRELDRSGEYAMQSGGGNPANHHSIKQYLKSVTKEQQEARIVPRKATPVFFDKFHKIILPLRDLISQDTTTAIDKYTYARDLTFFIIAFFTCQRASDLGRLC